MCHGSAVEVSAHSSEVQICATELIPTIWKITPPIPRRGSDLSEADGTGVACGLKMATHSLTVLLGRDGSVPRSASELACDCLGKWSMVEVALGLLISTHF